MRHAPCDVLRECISQVLAQDLLCGDRLPCLRYRHAAHRAAFCDDATVIEQTTFTYDDIGNHIATTFKQRYDDASGTGPLQNAANQPKARVSYMAAYPDALGRTQAEADYGTNSGSIWTRPTTIPPRTANVRVTSYQYDPLGHPVKITDPAAISTCRTWDKAGRLITVVENCDGGSSSSSGPSDARTRNPSTRRIPG